MRRILFFITIVLLGAGCKEKIFIPEPLPDATFTTQLSPDDYTVFYFNLHRNETYTLDFGDGIIQTDSLKEGDGTKALSIVHQYSRDGSFTATLTVKNKNNSHTTQQSIEVNYVFSIGFSYELLENGRLKIKNISENATSFQWAILNGDKDAFISTERDIDVKIDLNGSYLVKLRAYRRDLERNVEKIINIKTAKKPIDFTGYFDGKYIDASTENYGFIYSNGFASGDAPNAPLKYMGLYQHIFTDKSPSLASEHIQTRFYSLFPYPAYQGFGIADPPYNLKERYMALKKYLTKENDPDIMEVTEEDLDPVFYNNTNSLYPKAFWVKYKIKENRIDGIIKVRIVVYGYK